MGKEMVSVVIPAYNAEKFIEDAIRSCFAQTHRPLEIIVVNDGSTDSTVDVVNGLSDLSPDNQIELRIIDIGENRGAANALNVGFSKAKGDYVCWLSADDIFIDKKKIQRQIECMNNTNALWSYFRDSYVGPTLASAKLRRSSYLPHMRILDPLFIRDHELRLMMLLFRNPVNGSSTMFKKTCIERYGQFDPITRNIDGDGDLWMRYSALGLRLTALRGAPVFYREHALQTSKRRALMIYGCELTRMRILYALEKRENLVRLIKKFVPFFLIILKFKLHFERPLASEFLFDNILNHKKEFDRIFVKRIQNSLIDLRRHANYLMLDNNAFQKNLDLFLKSYTFKNFEEILFRR